MARVPPPCRHGFRRRADRWPDAVDANAVERFAAAVREVTMTLAGPTRFDA